MRYDFADVLAGGVRDGRSSGRGTRRRRDRGPAVEPRQDLLSRSSAPTAAPNGIWSSTTARSRYSGAAIMTALRDRPTHLQRFPDGIEGEEIYQKRLPAKRPEYRGHPARSRSRRAARPTSLRVRQRRRTSCGLRRPGQCHVPSVGGAVPRPRPPRRAAHRPGSAAGHRVRRGQGRGAGCARAAARRTGAGRVPEDVRRPRAPRVRPHRTALGLHRGAPRGASRWPGRSSGAAPTARDHRVVEGGTRRTDLHRLQPERQGQDHRVGLLGPQDPDRDGVDAGHLGGTARTSTPTTSPSRPCPSCSPNAAIPWRPIDDMAYRWTAAGDGGAGRRERVGRLPYPPQYPKMPGEPKRVQPSKDRDRK